MLLRRGSDRRRGNAQLNMRNEAGYALRDVISFAERRLFNELNEFNDRKQSTTCVSNKILHSFHASGMATSCERWRTMNSLQGLLSPRRAAVEQLQVGRQFGEVSGDLKRTA